MSTAPEEFIKDTAERDGLRYQFIGDEGEWFVVVGHPDRKLLESLANWHAKEMGFYEVDANYYDDMDFTWARLLWSCPDHPETCPSSCAYFYMEKGAWWLDWAVPRGEKSDVNHGALGYFPITVWDVES